MQKPLHKTGTYDRDQEGSGGGVRVLVFTSFNWNFCTVLYMSRENSEPCGTSARAVQMDHTAQQSPVIVSRHGLSI